MTRRAGVSVPLFSCRSTKSWGLGELADLVPLSRWLVAAGFTEVMLLPLGTMPAGETSPYSATSTLAIDPIHIALEQVADFGRAGGLRAMSDEGRRAAETAQHAPAVRYDAVRRAKHEALGLAFSSFVSEEWEQLTPRAADLAAFVARERWWLDDYALFQALSRSADGASWRDWPAPLRDRDPRAIDDARRQLSRGVLQEQYLQWTADGQWRAARRAAADHGVGVIGDMPFVPGYDSPEVWARPDEFHLDLSAGVPPDAFSPTGQDWALPTYRWNVIGDAGYAWLRRRAERMAQLFDGTRVDHVVGLYRTYARARDGSAFFIPAEERAQRIQGEQVVGLLKATGLDLIAEDLGSIPDFVRASLTAMGVPGCRVMRWERRWHDPGQPYIDPPSYPPLSAAMTGTHDTEPMPVWWDSLAAGDRASFLALPAATAAGMADASQPWSDRLRDLVLEMAYASGSDRLFLPMPDLFGWPDRINTPGTVRSDNWTWCLPWAVDRLDTTSAAQERAAFLLGLARSTGRFPTRD
jgi:4-alpha-glucanotransferase